MPSSEPAHGWTASTTAPTGKCSGCCASPTEAIGQALGQLSTGELRVLSRHLTTATRQWLGPPPPDDAGEDR
jgi:hypothetical protein